MIDTERRASSEKPRLKRGIPPIVLIAAGLALIAYISLNLIRPGQERRLADLQSIAAKLGAETVPLRFMVLSREAAAIELRVRLHDLSGAEVAKFETTLPGNELFFDFLLSPLPGNAAGTAGGVSGSADPRWLAFPYRIFTDTMPAAEGELLFARYDRSGFPRIFEGRSEELPGLSATEKVTLAALFARLRGEAASGPAPGTGGGAENVRRSDFGSAVHELSALSRFTTGMVYKIVCRAKGGVEIMEDDR